MKSESLSGNLMTFAAIGYPKVGNTWLRITLGRYLQNLYHLKEMPLMDSAEFSLLASAGSKTIGEFTHHPLEWTVQRESDLTFKNTIKPFCGQRIVLLVRHPLDTLVSQFMQERFRNNVSPYAGDLNTFIEDPIFGLSKLIKFYCLWANADHDVADMHIWRYEDAHSSPAKALLNLLQFLGEDVNSDALDEAVAYASFNNLSAIERSGNRNIVYKSSGLYVFGSDSSVNPNAMHVRKGQVYGYKYELPTEIIERHEARVRAEMPAIFGYS